MTKEQEINKLMETLSISREEAEETYDFDHDKTNNDYADSLTAKAKSCIRPYEQSKPTKATGKKERKIDKEKDALLKSIKPVLEQNRCENITVKTETEISFSLGDNSYSLKLIKHKKG